MYHVCGDGSERVNILVAFNDSLLYMCNAESEENIILFVTVEQNFELYLV